MAHPSRRSVSYDYQRGRLPGDHLIPSDGSGSGLRIVSDDPIIRHRHDTKDDNESPTSAFEFFQNDTFTAPYPVYDVGMDRQSRSRASLGHHSASSRMLVGSSHDDLFRPLQPPANAGIRAEMYTERPQAVSPPHAHHERAYSLGTLDESENTHVQGNSGPMHHAPYVRPPRIHLPHSHSNLFSFSEADASVVEISPVRSEYDMDRFDTNTEFVSPQGLLPLVLLALKSSLDRVHLPQKSEPSVSSAIGLIIGTYDYSSSLVALGQVRTHDSRDQGSLTPSSHPTLPPPAERSHGPQEPLVRPGKDHNRNNSASSSTSLASTSSTLTNKTNGQQRFLRYAMTNAPLSLLTKWLMGNVLAWLDYHGFNESWKETFRRNEISGNRFLELSHYDANLAVWQQFSQSLGLDGHNSVVERFIHLLRLEVDTPALRNDEERKPEKKDRVSENRKSSTSLWASTTSTVGVKPRPFSYVDPASMKMKEPHHKFFRKHHRNSSTDSAKESPSSGRPSLENVPSSSSTAGSRKSGLFSTLRKYGGDKAVGIVKQVQTSSTTSGKLANRKSVLNFPAKKHDFRNVSEFKNVSDAPKTDGFKHISTYSESRSEMSPKSAKSFSAFHADEMVSPIESAKLSTRSFSAESKRELIDPQYFPHPKSSELFQKLIMLTKDNNSFIPASLDAQEVSDVALLKKKFYRVLDMIDIGVITFHLTDFNADPGEPMSDEVLALAVQQDFFVKIKVTQTVQTPFGTTGTFSSTSSDSKSFDTTGDNNGKMYPATPQYLLQESRDKNVDYLNFKEQELSKISESINDRKMERMAEPVLPIKLSMPTRRLQKENAKKALPLINTTTPLNEPLDATMTAALHKSVNEPLTSTTLGAAQPNVKPKPNPVVDNSGSFSVLRKEGREIDFDQRRQVSTDSRAPRLIPNIYSSSVGDSAVSPISASTISPLKDDKLPSPPSTRPARQDFLKETSRGSSPGSEGERSFVARRKAPPPPSNASSMKLSNKVSISSLRSLPAPSTRSDISQLGESILSIRSSLNRDPRLRSLSRSSAFSENKVDFGDVPEFEAPKDQDEDSFFVKPINKAKSEAHNNEDEFFMKKPKKILNQMNVRPPVEELYNNLEKYFPNTNLDKPIIDDSAEPPNVTPVAASRKVSISRTFSNANISPVNPPTEGRDDEYFYGDGPKLRRRMKTIRIVANEARIKRLASQRAESGNQQVALREKSATPISLGRANTKLWGQKVVEVTPAEIDKGFVSRMRNSDGDYEEYAWIKGELIGRGSFGSVYLALNVTTGEMLAVKQVVVHGEAARNSEGLEALHKEVETMRYLDHLNIVQYLGFEQKKTTYSLFLEYVAGGSISSCLKAYGKFDEPLVKFITRQVLEGLKYLHSNGILHRDLKADNLLLEIDGTCKISDFGISKKSQDIYSNNADMSMQGTIFWMAPEVIHNMVEDKKLGYSAKVDIWSLGCVVLEMFAGKRPWSNEAVVSAIYKIGKTKLAPPIPKEISDEAKDFVNKCFTIDSEKRPTAAELLCHPFMSIDANYNFAETKLGKTIKFNSRKSIRTN